MPDSGRDGGRDLEQELRDLGSHLEYPPTPDLARAARLRLEAEADTTRTARRGRFWLPALSPRWAVAAMVVIVLTVPALSPNARNALSGLFVAGGTSYGGGAARSGGEAGSAGEDKVMSGQAGSQDAPSAAEEAVPESASGGQADFPESGGSEAATASFAERITLREARVRAGADRPLLLPETPVAGRPDEVYDAKMSYGSALGFVYRARPGLPPVGNTGIRIVLTETPGDLGATYLRDIPGNRTLEEVEVGGDPGYWIREARLDPLTSGLTASGRTGRPQAGVLLWNRDGLALRLESNLTREEAMRIAESVR